MADEQKRPRPQIVDPHNVQAVFVDWIVTGGTFEGSLNLSLGTIDHSMKPADEDLARVVVASHLRMTTEFALRLHAALGNLLGIAPAEGFTPPPEPQAPKNTLN
jgi:hypothetical protein